MTEFTYQDITSALQRVDIASDAAECHGAMSAVVCFVAEAGYPIWLGSHLPEVEAARQSGDALATEVQQITEQLYRQLCDQLLSGELGFRLLLPDDDLDLALRSQALAHWCQGFLLGLGYVGVTNTRAFEGELAEIIEDITEISQMTVANLDYSEEEEQSYTELVEYLKVGVMLFRETLHARQVDLSTSTLH